MNNTADAPRLLGLKTVKDRTSLSEMTIRRMIERSQFPRPVKLSSNRVAWRELDVTTWINSRVEAA
jgi:prophage regulatory protein